MFIFVKFNKFTRHVFFSSSFNNFHYDILTTNLAAVVCVSVSVCAKFDQFLPVHSDFDSKRPEIFVRTHVAIFPSATFGPLFSVPLSFICYEKQ